MGDTIELIQKDLQAMKKTDLDVLFEFFDADNVRSLSTILYKQYYINESCIRVPDTYTDQQLQSLQHTFLTSDNNILKNTRIIPFSQFFNGLVTAFLYFLSKQYRFKFIWDAITISKTKARSSRWCMKLIQYYFKRNELYQTLYMPHTMDIDFLVYIDDFSYSGNQFIQQLTTHFYNPVCGIFYGISSNALHNIQQTFTNRTISIFCHEMIPSITIDGQTKTPVIFEHKLADDVSTFTNLYENYIHIIPPYQQKQETETHLSMKHHTECLAEWLLQYTHQKQKALIIVIHNNKIQKRRSKTKY